MDSAILPERIISASACICDIHPDDAAFGWTNQTFEERKTWREKLRISEPEEARIHQATEEWMNEGRIGWGGLFFELDDALAYRAQFTGYATGSVIVEMATMPFVAEAFLAEFDREGENKGEAGLITALRRKQPVNDGGIVLGYDTFGFESSRDFHSFMCNSLEQEYRDKLGLKFTPSGLLADFESAVRAAAYNNDPQGGAEPVPWQPWRISEVAATC